MQRLCLKRRVDELGRIVIPKPYLQKLNIKEREEVDIILQEGQIILKKSMVSLNYEEIIRTSLLVHKGEKYKDYLISQKDVNTLTQILNDFVNNLF